MFETIRVYGGEPFAWTRHLDRLAHSASGLGLPVPDRDALHAAACEVLRANGHDEARLRITVTGGVAPLGSERGSAGPTVVVASSALRPWPDSVSVVIVPWVRNDRGATAGLKTTSYAENVRALAYAHERGASEAIFANTRDELCEATGSNVFVVRDGMVATPPGSSGCLLGVTRALVLELAEAAGIEVDELTPPARRPARRRRGLPHLDHARGPAHLPRRRPRASPRCPAPSPPPSAPRSTPSSPNTSTPKRRFRRGRPAAS